MVIGNFRHRVRLESPGDPVPDGKGGYIETWAPLDPAEWFCSIQAAAPQVIERLTAGPIQATATHLVRGRYHPGMTTETRILFEGRTLQVQSVTDIEERHIELVIICAEVIGNGSTTRRVSGISGGAPRVTR